MHYDLGARLTAFEVSGSFLAIKCNISRTLIFSSISVVSTDANHPLFWPSKVLWLSSGVFLALNYLEAYMFFIVFWNNMFTQHRQDCQYIRLKLMFIERLFIVWYDKHCALLFNKIWPIKYQKNVKELCGGHGYSFWSRLWLRAPITSGL